MSAGPNLLWLHDALEVCSALPPGVRFELAYLDPPYSVGGVMSMRDRSGQSRGRKRSESGRDAYTDDADVAALIAELEPRVAALRDRLADGGAFYLHLDYRAVHDAKVMCDRVFGRACFAGEIVWQPGNGARGARGFSVTHQTILIYGKDDRRVLFQTDHPMLREPYSATSLKMHFQNVDEEGRRYRERTVGGKAYRYYADEGRRIGTVWSDVPAMVANTPLMKEGTGYPTQKPEKLMERIVRASSREGDTVADLMCGSGTTLVVAARLGRRFVGGDQSAVAIEVTHKRLEQEQIAFRMFAADGGRAERRGCADG